MAIQVLLKKDVKGLGTAGAIVEAKPGYAHFLIAKAIAKRATPKMAEKAHELAQAAAQKAEEIYAKTLKEAEKIKNISLVIPAKAAESGELFAAITPQQVISAFAKYKVKMTEQKVKFPQPVKKLGNHEMKIHLHEKIEFPFRFMVVPEGKN